MRVHIYAHGREVTIECADANVSPRDVAAEALVLWKATGEGRPPSDGPAVGFAAERRGTRTVSPARSGYGYMGEVDA